MACFRRFGLHNYLFFKNCKVFCSFLYGFDNLGAQQQKSCSKELVPHKFFTVLVSRRSMGLQRIEIAFCYYKCHRFGGNCR